MSKPNPEVMINQAIRMHSDLMSTDSGRGCALKHFGIAKAMLKLKFDLHLINISEFELQSDNIDYLYNDVLNRKAFKI